MKSEDERRSEGEGTTLSEGVSASDLDGEKKMALTSLGSLESKSLWMRSRVTPTKTTFPSVSNPLLPARPAH